MGQNNYIKTSINYPLQSIKIKNKIRNNLLKKKLNKIKFSYVRIT